MNRTIIILLLALLSICVPAPPPEASGTDETSLLLPASTSSPEPSGATPPAPGLVTWERRFDNLETLTWHGILLKPPKATWSLWV